MVGHAFINSLMTKLYKMISREMRYKLRFLSRKNSDMNLGNTLPLDYTVCNY